MSSTNRGGKRAPSDNYPTPFWCVARLLEVVAPEGAVWMDPCAGTGSIIQAVKMLRPEIVWHSCEIRPECLEPLQNIDARPVIGDFLVPGMRFAGIHTIIMNPPYRLAQQFIEKSLQVAPHVFVLLRLNYLGSSKRNTFMRNHCPDIYVLPNRPAFRQDGQTDSIEYGWFEFRRLSKQMPVKTEGRFRVLPLTPKEERRF